MKELNTADFPAIHMTDLPDRTSAIPKPAVQDPIVTYAGAMKQWIYTSGNHSNDAVALGLAMIADAITNAVKEMKKL